MNIISITTPTADVDGAVILKPWTRSDTTQLSARVSRSGTLAGGAIITNQGVADGDRTLKIRSRVDNDDAIKLKNMFLNYPYLQIAIDDGVFYGSISRLNINQGQVNLEFLIQE